MINSSIHSVEAFAATTKIKRFIANPIKYLNGFFSKAVYYRITRKGYKVIASTFWGDSMCIELPASVDIYLSGGKTHDSEIRLAKFFICNVKESESMLDIGAHIGYFSLLFSSLSKSGKIISVEASPRTYSLLSKNVASKGNVTPLNNAISETNGIIEFMEFPVLYSEYNTLNDQQYKNESWFKSLNVSRIKIKAITADDLIMDYKVLPTYIKIDVEGAEDKVISGLQNYLKNYNPFVIMEFAKTERGNINHILAEKRLSSLEYFPHRINKSGKLEKLTLQTQIYIDSLEIESDNIVYVKNTR